MATKQQLKVDDRTLTLSNLDKILYPVTRFTKAQVIDYYARVAEWILPHLKDRPVTMRRFPDGTNGQAFYEKDAPRFTPEWVETAAVPRRYGGTDIRYVLINNRATLVWCANLASLELHPFLHRAPKIDTPTSMVFDLDPGPRVNVVGCAKVALLLRDVLAQLKLQSFAKLSGSKGIQLYVPLNMKATYEQTQPFAKALAHTMAEQHPDTIIAEMKKELRAGKVFIDWSQNSDFKTTVGVYSLRAKTGRPFVSLPVTWDEMESLANDGDANRFCLDPESALARLDKTADLFAPVLKLKQKLPTFATPRAR